MDISLDIVVRYMKSVFKQSILMSQICTIIPIQNDRTMLNTSYILNGNWLIEMKKTYFLRFHIHTSGA